MDDSDPSSEEHKRELLAAARQDFPAFYRAATPDDKMRMDGLVMAHVALRVGLVANRDGLHGPFRDALEKVTDMAEREFTKAREAVRACPTFTALSAGEQLHIELVIFEVKPP